MSINEQKTKTLENDIKQYSHAEQKLNNIINKTIKEKEQTVEDLHNLSDRFDAINEELNAKNYQATDYKEKLLENQSHLAKIQHELQSAQTENSNLQKELQLAKETQGELREKIKVSSSGNSKEIANVHRIIN